MSNEKLQFISIISGMLLGSYVTVWAYELSKEYSDQIKDYTHSTWLTFRDWFFQTKFPSKESQLSNAEYHRISAGNNPATCVP